LYEIEQVVPFRLLDASELVFLQSNPTNGELGYNAAAGIDSQPYAMEQTSWHQGWAHSSLLLDMCRDHLAISHFCTMQFKMTIRFLCRLNSMLSAAQAGGLASQCLIG